MSDVEGLATRLATAGFIAADDEARELLDAAKGDRAVLESLVERRLGGEPLGWITGSVTFCGTDVLVAPGVYVPRWQSEPLALRALARLPERGCAIDLCTGSGAIAKVLRSHYPDARIVATDDDEHAVACAGENGVEVYRGDLFEPLPGGLNGAVDVIVAVVPYVPARSMDLLPRDTLRLESTASYDGGDEGVDVLRKVIAQSPRFLRHGAALLLELGGDQAELLADDLSGHGFSDVVILVDDDGDARGIEATFTRR